MNKQILKHLAVSCALLWFLLSASLSGAQVAPLSKLAGRRPGSSAGQAANDATKTLASSSYTYTLLSIPGTVTTYLSGINLGVTNPKMEIVGGGSEGGGVVRMSGKKIVTETYQPVNYPHISGQEQNAFGINDVGQIVGVYIDGLGVYHGYELSGGKFTTLNVPFAGATGTSAFAINNSGEIIGQWFDATGNTHSFAVVGGTYTALDYPGADYTEANAINSNGDIVGAYAANGVINGFLLSGGTYTSFDVPGAISTGAFGINDAGAIVGEYCTTSECVLTSAGAQGFLLSGGVFTTITMPGEFSTFAFAINNNGVILSQYQDAAGLVVSFLETPNP
jgi:uncharacterized membrane protein